MGLSFDAVDGGAVVDDFGAKVVEVEVWQLDEGMVFALEMVWTRLNVAADVAAMAGER